MEKTYKGQLLYLVFQVRYTFRISNILIKVTSAGLGWTL